MPAGRSAPQFVKLRARDASRCNQSPRQGEHALWRGASNIAAQGAATRSMADPRRSGETRLGMLAVSRETDCSPRPEKRPRDRHRQTPTPSSSSLHPHWPLHRHTRWRDRVRVAVPPSRTLLRRPSLSDRPPRDQKAPVAGTDSAHASPYGRDLADAARRTDLASRWVSWHVR